MTRVLLDRDCVADDSTYRFSHSPLSAKWIGPEAIPARHGFWAFRRRIDSSSGPLRIHVSADQRYVLFLNGRRVGRGPERGDLRHWMYETYDLDLPAGTNTLVAIVWFLSLTGGTPPPWAQITQRPGFLLQSDGTVWDTGEAWEIKTIDGLSVETDQLVHFPAKVVGPRVRFDGRSYPPGIETGDGDGWAKATVLQSAMTAARVAESSPYWLLRPAMLPAMLDTPLTNWIVRHVDTPPSRDTADFAVESGQSLPVRARFGGGAHTVPGDTETVPPHTRRRFIIDLQTYACAYTCLTVAGGRGAFIRLRWAESLYRSGAKPVKNAWDVGDKGNRDEIQGRHFLGTGDTFRAGGGAVQRFEPLWWNAGRYIELLVENDGEPLTIESLELRATGYPYVFESTFAASDERLAAVQDLALHTLKMCSHETSTDCPYYEQLNYTGDTRLQSLVAMATSRDDRLVRKGLHLFDWSRSGDTWTASRWPTSETQTIPPFAMWWACMAYDYALWRGDLPLIKTLMPGVRSVLERWRQQIAADGLLRQPAGWNFVDWVRSPGWPHGMANPDIGSPCGILQWQLVYTLMKAADLEDWLGEPLLAQRNRQTAAMLAAAAERAFFDPERGLLATDPAKRRFSEHAQVLALLSGQLSANLRESVAAGITGDGEIDRTTIYFRHYAFEALADLGRTDLILQRMDTWFEHPKMGLFTLLEQPEPSRSDCHAWAAHPAYHFYASILGIRPASPGFATVRITPQLGPLGWAKGEMVHPKGTIRAEFRQENGSIGGFVELPPGITGELVLPGGVRALGGGRVNL